MTTSEPPHEFRCAITLEIMEDPAVTDDGHVYERRVIQKWFDSGKRTSPVTNKVLQSTTLRECIPLRNLILDWKAKNGISEVIHSSSPSKKSSVPQASHEDVLRVLDERKKNDQGRGCKITGTLHKETTEYSEAFVRLVPPKLGSRRPASFVCVVDVSGSMNSNTESPNPDEIPFTRMNLVVHSIRALAQTLLEEDLFSLVTFGSNTKTILDNVLMTQSKRKDLERILEDLDGSGSTDMMGGLQQGIRLTQKTLVSDCRPTFVIFLTDGDATTQPTFKSAPFANFTRYLISQGPFAAAIHTFGYGYELDSKALYDISQVGGGVFSFIPDSTMVGTAMVNVFSASAATVFSKVRVRITSSTPISSVEGYEIDVDRNDLKTVDIDVGALQFGQSRDLLVKIKNPSDGSTPVVFLEAFFDCDAQKAHNVYCIDKYEKENGQTENDKERAIQLARFCLVNALKTVIKSINMDTYYAHRANAKKYVNEKSLTAAREEMKRAYQVVQGLNESSAAAGDERLAAILSDIHNDESENVGQIGKALSKPEWYIKWGGSYLISLLTALQQQVCHNFKDKSVQNFGGALFEKLQDKAQTAFCTLPPPKSTGFVPGKYNSNTSTYTAPTYTAPTNMSNYYTAYGGCIHGQGRLKVSPSTSDSIPSADGYHKLVENVQKGDKVSLPDGTTAEVLCVVETVLPAGAELSKVDDLLLTPFHPILTSNSEGVAQWQFPCYLPQAQMVPFHGTVFDFVLDRGHTVTVNGVQCICLGHGRNEDPILAHPYYGTQKVIEDLQKLSGWEVGRVVVRRLNRDPSTKLVTGIAAPNLSSLSA